MPSPPPSPTSPDVIRLALFGHTHMDEFRTITTPDGTIPVKLVPSITPVNGNDPAFTVAEFNPSTATLMDYAVYSANNQSGIDATWTEEYRYSTTYHLPDLSGASPRNSPPPSSMTNPAAPTPATPTRNSSSSATPVPSKGIKAVRNALAMQIVWPAYACAITHADAASFRTCACPASTPPRPNRTPLIGNRARESHLFDFPRCAARR